MLTAAAFVSTFERFVVVALIVVIALDLGTSLARTLWVASAFFLAYGLCQPIWGIASDRFGRVVVMRVALLGGALGGLASVLAPGLGWLVVARFATGACIGGIVPTALTYVGDTVAPQRRQAALSDLMGAMAIGTAVATAVGGILGETVGWRVVFAVPMTAALAGAFVLRTLPEPPGSASGSVRQRIRAASTDRRALVVYALVLIEGALLLGSLTLLAPALQTQGVDAARAGLATAAYGIGTIVFTRVVRRLSATWPIERLMPVGGAAMSLGGAVVAVHLSPATVVVAALCLGCAWAFLHSSLQTWATQAVPHARGTTVSFFAACLFIGSGGATALAGPIVDAGHWTPIFAGTCLGAIPLTAAAILGYRRLIGPS